MGKIPDVGKEAVSKHVFESTPDVAVGIGTANVTNGDTALANEVYRSNPSNSNVTRTNLSADGKYQYELTVAGGREVTPGTAITELGLFDKNGVLIYRETRTATTVTAGEEAKFTTIIEVVS